MKRKQLKTPQDREVRKIFNWRKSILDNAFDISISSTSLHLAWTRQFKVKISVAPSFYDWAHLGNALKQAISSLSCCSNGDPGLYLRRPYKIYPYRIDQLDDGLGRFKNNGISSLLYTLWNYNWYRNSNGGPDL